MSDLKVGVIRETGKGTWMIEVDGTEVLQTKSLVWVKSNARKSAKLRKTGVRVFDVTEDGKTTRWNMDAKTVRKAKKSTATAKKTAKAKTKSAKKTAEPVVTEMTVEGLNTLKGKTKSGRVISQDSRVTVIEFLTQDNIAVPTEFSTKTGEQLNHGPNHGWKIQKSA